VPRDYEGQAEFAEKRGFTTEARRVKNGGGCGHLVPTSRRVGTNDHNVVFWEAEEPSSVYSSCADRSVSCARPVFGDRATDRTSVSVLLSASVLALRSLWAKQGLRGRSFRSGIAEQACFVPSPEPLNLSLTCYF